jgi:hypothetical protein
LKYVKGSSPQANPPRRKGFKDSSEKAISIWRYTLLDQLSRVKRNNAYDKANREGDILGKRTVIYTYSLTLEPLPAGLRLIEQAGSNPRISKRVGV